MLNVSLAWLLTSLAAPAPADAAPVHEAAQEARQLIGAYRVNLRTGCALPIPARWNATPREQEASWRRREAFERCLADAMYREEWRLQELSSQIEALRADCPHEPWSPVERALREKWGELDELESKLRNQSAWADTAVRILDTFTGPGAPLDDSGYGDFDNRTRSIYAPHGRGGSVSAPGIK